MIWPKDQSGLGDKAIFRPKKLTWNLSFWVWPKDSLVLGWSGQKTPWCQGYVSTKESFGQIPPTPRSLFPNQKYQKLKFQVSFLGLNIALSPNLIGSYDADFHKDSESGLNSKIKKHQGVIWPNHCRFVQGQARGIWTYHSLKFEIWLYHEGPTLQSRITQKWLELSLSFFHIMKIWNICGHLQLVRWL